MGDGRGSKAQRKSGTATVGMKSATDRIAGALEPPGRAQVAPGRGRGWKEGRGPATVHGGSLCTQSHRQRACVRPLPDVTPYDEGGIRRPPACARTATAHVAELTIIKCARVRAQFLLDQRAHGS